MIRLPDAELPVLDNEGLTAEEKVERLREAEVAMIAALNAPAVTPGSKAEEIIQTRQSVAFATMFAAMLAAQ